MKKLYRLSTFFFLFLAAGPPLLRAQPFTRVEMEAGLGIVRNNNAVSVADYDRDGDLDLFFTAIKSFDPDNEGTWNRLMRNRGDGTFEDVTMTAGFTHQFINTDVTASLGEKLGASWGDYDNDGFPDLFLANSRLDQLYRNQGDGTFVDVTQQAGVAGCHSCYSSSGLWFDHDRDGDLDLYVSILNGANLLYLNNGDGTFTDITDWQGVGGAGVTWTTVALDVGKDGFLDLYCANDTQINEFFENRSGQRYNEAARAYRLADEGAGMGLAVGDYNNDGLFDIYVTNIYNHHPNPLFQDLGNRRFEDVAPAMGVDNTGWGWGTQFLDFDHDGDEDLAAVNGVVSKQYIDGQEQEDVQNFFFRNRLIEDGIPGFVDWSRESATDGNERARGLEVFDYDGDGDLDMVVANVESTPYLFRNETIGPDNRPGVNWLQIALEGTRTNRDAFGTEVRITIAGQSYYRWHHGAAFYAQSIKPVHFGVGEATVIDEVRITWLSGEVQTLNNVAANQQLVVREGGTTPILEVGSNELQIAAFPNPFVDQITLDIQLDTAGPLELIVYTLQGHRVYRYYQARQPAGRQTVTWNGRDERGQALPAGLYVYTLHLGDQLFSGKISKLAGNR